MRIEDLTDPSLIFPDLAALDPASLLREFSERLAEKRLVDDASALYDRLVERERLCSTGLGSGVAVPHCKLPGLRRGVLAIGVSRQGIDFGSVDGQPAKLFFLLVSPTQSPAEHLQSLAAISKWVKVDNHVDRLLEMADPEEIFRLLSQETGNESGG